MSAALQSPKMSAVPQLQLQSPKVPAGLQPPKPGFHRRALYKQSPARSPLREVLKARWAPGRGSLPNEKMHA